MYPPPGLPRLKAGVGHPPPALPYLHISGFRVADSEKALIFGHFLHSATRKGQFGVSRCFDSSLGICVDTVAQVRGREQTEYAACADRNSPKHALARLERFGCHVRVAAMTGLQARREPADRGFNFE